MISPWQKLAFALLAIGMIDVAQATPTCNRKPDSVTETSPTGTRTFPLSGPCHALSISPPTGVPVTGFMMIIAAGGWNSNPQAVRDFHNRYAQRFANDGFFTYTVEHTPGTGTALGPRSGNVGMANVVQHYDDLRAFANSLPNGSAYPVCVFGESSGGNFALLLGVSRPDLSCIIAQAGPTDLRTVSSSMPAVVRQLAIDAFGESNLAVYSPIAWAALPPPSSYLRQKVLLGHGYADPLVGRDQSTSFCALRPNSSYCYILDTTNGTAAFTHVLVTPASLNYFQFLEQVFAP